MLTQKSFSNGTEFPPLPENTLRLYSMRFCPYAERTRLVLAHKNIPHETVNVHLVPACMKPDWFLKRTPLGLVPVLEKDGKIVYESTVCNEYLDAVYPEKPLLPKDPYQKARDKMLLHRAEKLGASNYRYLVSKGKDEEAFEGIQQGLTLLEEELPTRGDFFGGANVGMLDYNLWPMVEPVQVFSRVYNRAVLTEEKHRYLLAWYDRMRHLPAVQECSPPVDAMIKFLETYVDGKPDYDVGLDE